VLALHTLEQRSARRQRLAQLDQQRHAAARGIGLDDCGVGAFAANILGDGVVGANEGAGGLIAELLRQ
jgi:hypothetical protein